MRDGSNVMHRPSYRFSTFAPELFCQRMVYRYRRGMIAGDDSHRLSTSVDDGSRSHLLVAIKHGLELPFELVRGLRTGISGIFYTVVRVVVKNIRLVPAHYFPG